MTYADAPGVDTRNSHIRFWIIAVLFVVSSINYASRATFSFATVPLQREIHLTTVQIGFIFSAFGWSYAFGQIPGGALLDRFGSRPVYLWSITLWAIFTAAQAFVTWLSFVPVMISLFVLRLALGVSESPSFPANARIVANWFPHSERGTASAIFNSAQYFSLVAFAPLMGWLAQDYGWRSMFVVMGGIGFVGAALFFLVVQSPARHKRISRREYDYIEKNGALVNLDRPNAAQKIQWGSMGQLLANRMLLGIYLAQYAITALTYFYTTWFPIYLIRARHMSIAHAGLAAAGPAIAGFVGGVLGGVASDFLLKRGMALSPARKTVIQIGLVISCSILLCNYTNSQAMIMIFMTLAFFGKGVAALGWAVMSDAAPREATGLSGSIFNLFGNAAGIFTPIGIGYILAGTNNNWNMALLFVFAHSIVAMISYGFITGEIKRVVLKTA
jgi:ACS family glucarate transporter-like MFS transporter